MPRYDFRCNTCGNVEEVKRTIENRNRGPRRCTRQPEDVMGSMDCGGTYKRIWTPVEFRAN